jgi:hypothetical protein
LPCAWQALEENNSLQAERALGLMDVFFFDGMKAVPESETDSDDKANENADQKEQAVGRQRDEKNDHDRQGHKEGRGALQAETKAGLGIRRHFFEYFSADPIASTSADLEASGVHKSQS